MYCCDLSCTNGIVNKLKKKSVGTYALLHTQLQTLFHFYCSISGAHSLVNLNDLNFKKHNLFGCAYKNNMVLGILSQIALVLFLLHSNRFMDCTDFTPFWGMSGKLSEHVSLEYMYLCWSCEWNFVDVHVFRNCCSCCWTITRDDIHHTRRKSCLKQCWK